MAIRKLIKIFKKYLVFLVFTLIFASSLFLFYPSLNYYFFQDDWFVLNWVRTGDIASFFSFRTDIIYWRPLSMPIFFAFGKLLFGFKPFGFHLIAFLFHFVNIVLVYILFRKLKLSKNTSLLASFLYGTAAFHFIPLSWLATTSYIIGPTLIFSSIIFFISGRIFSSFIFFLLAIASTELALSIIPILFILSEKYKKVIRQLIPFIIIAISYLLIRFLVFPLPTSGQYEIGLKLQVLTNLFWYIIWFFNIPENMSTIFFFSKLKASIIASWQFSRYLVLPVVLIITFFIMILVSKLSVGRVIKGLTWFAAGILPVIFLPEHIYPMYMVIGSLGIFYIFSSSLEKVNNNVILGIFALLWFLSSFFTLNFTRNNHWIVNEQAISKAYINFAKRLHSEPIKTSFFVFKKPDKSVSEIYNMIISADENNIRQALNNNDAIQVVYNDSSLQSIFFNEGDILPENIKIYEIYPDMTKYKEIFNK